ncbi:retinol-binding protein pinta [Monomorium pharaonis]|uniref:retinol-binding protein pinta n=1 Tax=Monomorium pharaonis TaxID=307658 RepID=UPI001747141D|nr:retinol-binding protein pinta [Monomorium pharaonis]XP_036140016.1 retinol-binding protein pinta [Monomorium pharaonis]XP_036140017.1 retinol-binding protein pinta [Monomorium pharaonis]
MANKYGNIVHHDWQEMTSEDKKYAAENLNETDEIRENAVAEIRHWIKENDDFPAQIDDFLILRFLRVCKFDLEKTKARIRNHYKQQSDLPEWFIIKDPFQPEVQDILNLGIILPLRKRDSQGRCIFLMRVTVHDPERHKIQDLMKTCNLVIGTTVKQYPIISIYGCVLLIDVSNPTIRHVIQSKPYDLMNMIHSAQNCYPMRYQKIILFNVPTLFNIIVKIMRSFMTQKMKSRFHVYSDALDCFKDIPADILPVEYGGTDGTLQELIEYWKKNVEKNFDWLTKDEIDRTTQTAKPAEPNFENITHL